MAMQFSLQPSTAWLRFSPSRASQPLPASRLLQRAAGGIIEIRAACPLQQIAADGCGIAQLSRRAGEQGLGDGGIGPCEVRIVREIGVADECADTHTAVGETLDLIEAIEMRDVDQAVRTADAALHQIEQVGAGGKKNSARQSGGGNGLCDRGGPDIIERLHAERL
ncbi:hypothetical protein ACVIU7_005413 [Bradyrhizobium liaoningense]